VAPSYSTWPSLRGVDGWLAPQWTTAQVSWLGGSQCSAAAPTSHLTRAHDAWDDLALSRGRAELAPKLGSGRHGRGSGRRRSGSSGRRRAGRRGAQHWLAASWHGNASTKTSNARRGQTGGLFVFLS
jgi:hypothetical protein